MQSDITDAADENEEENEETGAARAFAHAALLGKCNIRHDRLARLP
jgi:hypothetical protein